MLSEADPAFADREIVALVRDLLARRQEVVDGMVDRIQREIAFYRADTVDREDLWASCNTNVDSIVTPLLTGEAVDLTSPRDTGRRRAEQHAPLPAVMAAYRIGFRHLWESLVAQARQHGTASSDVLVDAASTMWATHDAFTDAMTTAYRDAMATEMIRDERERSTLVDALLDGRIGDMAEIWDVADVLRLPAQGPCVVIAAEVPHIAQEALPKAEWRLAEYGIASAWCLRPDLQVGIACLGDLSRLKILVEILSDVATGRVGVSPPYPALAQTAPALRLARLALAANPPNTVGVAQFDASPLAVTAISAADVLARVSRTVLGSLLDLPADEQSVLLETLEAWRDNNGSASEAAAKLYCHANTVRHRLHRIEDLTGRSLTDPRAVADLCLALEGVRLMPGLPPS